MNLEALRTLCAAGEIMVTQHCMKRIHRIVSRRGHCDPRGDRGGLSDRLPVPQLPDASRRPARRRRAGRRQGTAYIPIRDEWESDLKTRRTKQFKCKGEMREGVTTFVSDVDDFCIVIRHVPCMKCDVCGEVAFSGDVAASLEKIVNAAKSIFTEVAVINYPDAVA